MFAEIWDGATPLRQVGIGLTKFSRETDTQLSLFEDPKLAYYRRWDREYDEKMAGK
jgi:hypothetical protein